MKNARAHHFLQLAHADTPQCAIAGDDIFSNDAFSALPTLERRRIVSALTAPSGEYVDAAGFRFAIVRLASPPCAIATGVPLQYDTDKRMKMLPSILNFSGGLLPNSANLHRLLDALISAAPALFECCVLFESKNDGAFVPVHVEPAQCKEPDLRQWPLEFAAARRRARIIAKNGGGRQALALPFAVSSYERYLVLAVLREVAVTEADRHFLRAVSCLSDRARQVRVLQTREADAAIPLPRLTVAYYGNGKIDERCASLFAAWEWSVISYSPASLVQRNVAADIVVVDGHAVSNAGAAMRALRATAPRAFVVFLGTAPADTEALADEVIAPGVSALSAGRVFKQAARDLQNARLRETEAATARDVAEWDSFSSTAELARRLAALLVRSAADWAAVHIVDDDGTAHAVELPAGPRAVIPELPDFFLSGYSLFRPYADGEFYREISKREETQERLASLGALSGAAVPISAEGALIGCVVALSMHDVFEPARFERISRAAAAAGNAYSEMKRNQQRTRRSGSESAVCSAYRADTFNGPKSSAIASVSVSSTLIGIEVSGPGAARLSGRLDITSGTLSYEGNEIAEPLVVNQRGTLAVLPVGGSERRITLAPGTIVLLYPKTMETSVGDRRIAALLQSAAQKREWSVKPLLAEALGTDSVFAAISAPAV